MIPNQELAETNMKKYMKKMIELDRKFNEKEISWEEYLKKLDELDEEIEKIE